MIHCEMSICDWKIGDDRATVLLARDLKGRRMYLTHPMAGPVVFLIAFVVAVFAGFTAVVVTIDTYVRPAAAVASTDLLPNACTPTQSAEKFKLDDVARASGT